MLFFFFFKQKTAYEMRISDWSSDVCSSDLDHEIWLPGVGLGVTASSAASLSSSPLTDSKVGRFCVSRCSSSPFALLRSQASRKARSMVPDDLAPVIPSRSTATRRLDRKSTRLNSSH